MEYDRDRDHLNILGVVYYVSAGLSIFGILFSLIYAVIGILFLCGVIPSEGRGEETEISGLIFLIFGGGIFLLCLAYGVLSFLAGRWLRSGKHRIFCFVVACLNLPNMPIGTLLGVFTILVLSRPRVIGLFAGLSDSELEAAAGVAPEIDNALAAPVDA